MLGNFFQTTLSNLKYVPYKMGQPKRLMALLLGVVGLAAGYSLAGKTKWQSGWKTFLMSFGAVSIGAYVAGVINPVTLYNQSRYGSTTEQIGRTAGQTDPQFGYSPPGAYYSADGQIIAPGLCFGPDNTPMPCASPRDPLLPAVGQTGVQLYGSTTENIGRTTGQTDPFIPGQPPGAYYGVELRQPSRPVFNYGAGIVVGCNPLTGEGCNEVPPAEGDIYIRDPGEVQFNGGI